MLAMMMIMLLSILMIGMALQNSTRNRTSCKCRNNDHTDRLVSDHAFPDGGHV